jgi:hypothetical protein
MHDLLYPNFEKAGLHGSVNAASMMDFYANFSYLGLFLSALLHGFIFAIISRIFQGNPAAAISFNMGYILLLSSGAITTILFSGGWGAAVLLFVLFGREQHEPLRSGGRVSVI